MSEQRFWLVDNHIRDNMLVGEKSLTLEEVCEKLNEQQGAIQSLKEENDDLRKTNEELLEKYLKFRLKIGELLDE